MFSVVFLILESSKLQWGLPGGPSAQEPACNAGEEREAGSISRSRRSLEEGTATHSSILAWRTPWTEEPGRLQFIGHKEPDRTEVT